MGEFSLAVQEKLEHYVYALTDLRKRVFYVGKGVGNRAYSHIDEAYNKCPKTKTYEKLDKIREIGREGVEAGLMIIRHGLKNDKEAFLVESVVMDILSELSEFSNSKLTNRVRGHDAVLDRKSHI